MSRRQRGFTLIEVVLAFALLSVGLGLLVSIQGGGLRQVLTAAEVGEATQHAQSLLDSLGVLERLQPGRSEGEFEDRRYRWSLLIEETTDPAPVREPGQEGTTLTAPTPRPGAADGVDPPAGRGRLLGPGDLDSGLVASDLLDPAETGPLLYRIELVVSWTQGDQARRLVFHTLRSRQRQLLESAP